MATKKSTARKTAGKKGAAITSASRKQTAARKREGPQRKTGGAKTQTSKSSVSLSTPAAPDPKRLAHGLRALLHTMQTVQRFEEALCSMMHSIEHKRLTAALLRELRATLENLPADDYRDDVADLLHELG